MRGIIDSTLREGGQTVGVSFSLAQKREIIRALSEVGVEEIEAGVVAGSDDDLVELMRGLRTIEKRSAISLWSRCNTRDIFLAGLLQPDILSLSIPVSDLHIKQKLGKSRQWVVDTVHASVRQALRAGIVRVAVGLEDASRADEAFLCEVACAAAAAGAFRLRLADTVGIATPGEIAALIGRLKSAVQLPLGVHMHNDFGMATANSIAAIEAGADWADGTILGLGERAGNARLEEMIGYMALRKDRRYDTRALVALCNYVAEVAGRPIQPHQPIVGTEIFACETGLHLHGLGREPQTYEPYAPERVGQSRKLLYGTKIGRRAVLDRLTGLGHKVSSQNADEAVRQLHRQSRVKGRPLQESEVDLMLARLSRPFGHCA